MEHVFFKAVSPDDGRHTAGSIDVSSYGEPPYDIFSPFSFSNDYQIPVPGQSDVFARSVESIWQGLKIIEGTTSPALFKMRPRKRKGNVEGHEYEGDVLDIHDARQLVYRPAYEFHFNNHVSDDIKKALAEQAVLEPVLLYDVESNIDFDDPAPLAHSAFAALLMEQFMITHLKSVMEQLESIYWDNGNRVLEGSLAEAKELFKTMQTFEQGLLRDVLKKPRGRDPLHRRYYAELCKGLRRDDNDITKQLNLLTGDRAQYSTIDIMIERNMPIGVELLQEFDRHTHYQVKEGQLCSEDRRLAVNAYFLNSCLGPGIKAVQAQDTMTYTRTLKRLLNSVKDESGCELSLFLFMDTARLLPTKMDSTSIRLVERFAQDSGTSALIAAWGFLSGQIGFGSNVRQSIGTQQSPGPLAIAAKNRAIEIRQRITDGSGL